MAVQAHADIELPTGQIKPLSNFFVTVAESGERKTAADNLALVPLKDYEGELTAKYEEKYPTYQNDLAAWEGARSKILKPKAFDKVAVADELNALGEAPKPPLNSTLTCSEPTYEGLCKLFGIGQPSLGLLSKENCGRTGNFGRVDQNSQSSRL